MTIVVISREPRPCRPKAPSMNLSHQLSMSENARLRDPADAEQREGAIRN